MSDLEIVGEQPKKNSKTASSRSVLSELEASKAEHKKYSTPNQKDVRDSKPLLPPKKTRQSCEKCSSVEDGRRRSVDKPGGLGTADGDTDGPGEGTPAPPPATRHGGTESIRVQARDVNDTDALQGGSGIPSASTVLLAPSAPDAETAPGPRPGLDGVCYVSRRRSRRGRSLAGTALQIFLLRCSFPAMAALASLRSAWEEAVVARVRKEMEVSELRMRERIGYTGSSQQCT